MAESTQRADDLITVGEEYHEETGFNDKMSTNSPSKTERGLDLENIEINLPPENIENTCNSERSGKEKEQHPSQLFFSLGLINTLERNFSAFWL